MEHLSEKPAFSLRKVRFFVNVLYSTAQIVNIRTLQTHAGLRNDVLVKPRVYLILTGSLQRKLYILMHSSSYVTITTNYICVSIRSNGESV